MTRKHQQAINKLKRDLESKGCTNFETYGVEDGMLEYGYTDANGVTHIDDIDLDYKGGVS